MRLRQHINHASDLRSDGGFSIVSVMVAISILTVVLIPATKILSTLAATSANIRDRVVASNLANQQVELLTAQAKVGFTQLVSTGLGTSSVNQTVNGLNYSVATTLSWRPGVGGSSCGSSDEGSSTLQPLLQVEIAVNWPSLSQHGPVRESTTLVPPTADFSNLTGNLSVRVVGASGAGSNDIPVTVTGPSSTSTAYTDSNGCAFFPFLPAGNYTTSLSSPEGQLWVDQSGNQNPSQIAGVSIGNTTAAEFTYDRAGQLDLNLPNSSEFPALPGAEISVANPLVSTSGVVFEPNGSTNVNGFFPFANGYQVWLGNCFSGSQTGPNSSLPFTVVYPGQSSNANIGASDLTLSVTMGGSALANAQVSLTEVDPVTSKPLTGCQSTGSFTDAGTTNSSGVLKLSVPLGSYSVAVTPSGSTGAITDPTIFQATVGGESVVAAF